MSWSRTTTLAAIELAIYIFLTRIIAFLALRHQWSGILGHSFLCGFSIIRIAGDIITISDRSTDPSHPSTSSAVLSSIGLTPLLLALSGFIHEAHHYQVTATRTQQSARRLKRWLWVAQVLIHVISTIGIALATTGASNLATAKTQEDVNSDNKKRAAGSGILLALWVVSYLYAIFVWRKVHNTVVTARTALARLALCTIVASVFVGVRAIYSLVYSVDHSPSINPITGTFAIKLILVVLVQLFAVQLFILGSWMSKGIATTEIATSAPLIAQEGSTEGVEPPTTQHKK